MMLPPDSASVRFSMFDARVSAPHYFQICSRARALCEDIASIVDEIGIVAAAADHYVGRGAAVEDVVPSVPRQAIHSAIANDGVVIELPIPLIVDEPNRVKFSSSCVEDRV